MSTAYLETDIWSDDGTHQVLACIKCGALVTEMFQAQHDNFHDKVEAALSASQGYNLDGSEIQ